MKTLSFTFKENLVKCDKHSQPARFYRTNCDQYLYCFDCLSKENENVNQCIDQEMTELSSSFSKYITSANLKRIYINEIQQMETLIEESQKEGVIPEESITRFEKSLIDFFSVIIKRKIKEVFTGSEENEEIEEGKERTQQSHTYTHMISNYIKPNTELNVEKVIQFLSKVDEYKYNIRSGMIPSMEKLKMLQERFKCGISKLEILVDNLLNEFFSKGNEENFECGGNEEDKHCEVIESKSESGEKNGSEASLEINEYMKEHHLEMFNEKRSSPCKKNLKKNDEIIMSIPKSKSSIISMKSNDSKLLSPFAYNTHIPTYTDSNKSSEKEPDTIEISTGEDESNRNRIKKLLAQNQRHNNPQKNKISIEHFVQVYKSKHANANTTPNYYQNNYNGKPSNSIQNGIITPMGNVKKTCIVCMNTFLTSKQESFWKKKCQNCQKDSKAQQCTGTNRYNTMKTGKISQICGKCKNVFSVPASLAKQRKTCYYCFKSNNIVE